MAGGEGSVFGKFFLLKRIASGGMGEIFLAKLKGPEGFEKLLVIKRILRHHLENQEFVDMFFAEARVAAQLTHANVVQIYEMGDVEDCYYIAMEYVHGKSLRSVLDRARSRGENVHPAHVIEVIGKVCSGMSYAHNATNLSGDAIGVIHRDLNPHNVLISYSGEVKIIDFGIAKSQMSTHRTESGTIKGKFVYMSPEQSAAEELDKRSDIFAIGICTYEALTFVNPFAKANVVMSLDAIQRHEPPPLADTRAELGPLDAVVGRALAKHRDDRYPDCADFRDALLRLREDGSIDEPPLTLAGYMHELFAEQIEDERRMILETDSANTSQIRLMQEGMEREHRPGSQPGYRLKTPRPLRVAADASAVALETPPHSRLPFFIILLGIVVLSGVAATVVYTLVEQKRTAAASSAVTLAPAPVEPPTKAPAVATLTPAEIPAVATLTPAEPEGETDSGAELEPAERGPEHAAKAAKNRKRKRRKPGAKPVSPPTSAEATARPPPSPQSFGHLQVSTVPPAKIFRNGAPAGQTLKLRSEIGKLIVGTGRNPSSDPFVVRIRYRVDGDQIAYAIDSEPWAIVRGNGGIGLGRTPLAPQRSAGKTTFELVNPQKKLTMRVTLRFAR